MCMLVVIGGDADGKKEILAIEPRYRESATSWKDLLLRLRDFRLSGAPELAIADGAPSSRRVWMRSFVHKRTRYRVYKSWHVLDKLPKSKQPEAKGMLHEIYKADTRKEAEKAMGRFVAVF